MSTTESATMTRTERLDRLQVSSKHVRLLGGSGVGWALDAMDVGLISFVMAALVAHWDLSATESSWLGSIGFAGMALGASLGGLLADKFGRRKIFALTLLVYGLATGASTLSAGLGMLLALRFVVGLGLGAELPVASTLISEFSPRSIRGRMVVLLEAFWAIGWIAAAVIGTFVVTASPEGWRWALALGCVPAAYALIVRFAFPESVRYLESKGRHGEAERIVTSFEEAAPLRPIRSDSPAPPVQGHQGTEAVDTSESIWSPRMRRRTIALWTIWFCINLSYYGAFIWIPSLLHAQGFTLVQSFGFTLVMTVAQIPGYALAAYLIEVWGRRATLSAFLAGSAIAAVCYGASSAEWSIVMSGCFLSLCNLGAWGALYAIGPELYPTPIRGTGTGAAAGFGRIASIVAPLIVPPLIAIGGTGILFGVFAGAFAIAGIAALSLPEAKGRALT
ncbi:MFS transporter [Rothia sp. HC945]|uniref:MFS transporter n=1 Tax=Rothia sp. HC945 TaxID=3171170 RepID=UPI003F256EC9